MKSLMRLLMLAMLVALLGFGLTGCGDDGSDGKAGLSAYEIAGGDDKWGSEQAWLDSLNQTSPTAMAEAVEPESCGVCHASGTVVRSGDSHQAAYDELFQQGVVTIENVAYSNNGTDDIVTFDMKKNGVAFACEDADNLAIAFAPYVSGTNTFELGSPGFNYSIAGTLSSVGGTCTSTKAEGTKGDLSTLDGVVIVYGYDEFVSSPGSHISLARYPFAGMQELGTVSYSSAANVTGCEKCHTTPYYKHGYIIGDAGAGQDFITCKLCHLDDLNGSHNDWQYMVDDPAGWANGDTPTRDYTYKKNLMNDVHMSHAMEFPYPQSMATCATCHAGKLTQTLSDENFTLETCKSCHPIDGGTDTANSDGEFAYDTRDLSLSNLLALENSGFGHNSVDLDDPTQNCNGCHMDGGIAPTFSEVHSGYISNIYTTDGTKYADSVTVKIDTAALSGTDLNITFSAASTIAGVDAADIVPTVYVAAYGYDTKDFIISNHSRDADRNRLGEFTLDGTSTSPYFSNPVINGDGTWSVTFDTTVFDTDGMITNGIIRRLEIAIAPSLEVGGEEVGLNAPSVTFNLDDNAIEGDYFSGDEALVEVETGVSGVKGCNSCHDQLATTFHSPDRGGNIVVCRMCHVVTSGGSHLEGQSRSIDSYTHAIHSFQAFDVDEVDFSDPVEKAHYEEHVNFLFPDFATTNCMACHDSGKFNVPDQSKSMPGLLSAADEVPGGPSATSPEVVTGPAARACGGCHRAAYINADDAGGYAAFNQHTKDFGYRIENDDEDSILYTVIEKIMSLFE